MDPKPTTLLKYVFQVREGITRRLNGTENAGIVMAGVFKEGYVNHRIRRKTLTKRIFFVGDVECWVLDWGTGPSECWVSSTGTRHNYRNVFRAFLRGEFGIDFDTDNARERDPFQVDHAHCCISVDQNNDADFVLLTPLEGRTNAAWGRIERALAANRYTEAPEALCSFLTMGKLLGLRPPRYSRVTDAQKEAGRYVGLLGDNGVELSSGRCSEIDGVMQFIWEARKGEVTLSQRRKLAELNVVKSTSTVLC